MLLLCVRKKDLLYGSHSYHTGIVIKAVDEFILSPFNRSGLYAYDMERDKGFEPSHPVWKTGMLAVEHQSRRVVGGFWKRTTKTLRVSFSLVLITLRWCPRPDSNRHGCFTEGF